MISEMGKLNVRYHAALCW